MELCVFMTDVWENINGFMCIQKQPWHKSASPAQLQMSLCSKMCFEQVDQVHTAFSATALLSKLSSCKVTSCSQDN